MSRCRLLLACALVVVNLLASLACCIPGIGKPAAPPPDAAVAQSDLAPAPPVEKPTAPSVEKPAAAAPTLQSKTPAPAGVPVKTKTLEKKPIETMWATDLWHAYNDNALAADLKYKSQVVRLKLTPAVRFEVKPAGSSYCIAMHTVHGNSPPSVYCYIAAGHEKGFASLTAKSSCLIDAEVVGRRTAAGPFRGFIVELRNSRIVDQAKQ